MKNALLGKLSMYLHWVGMRADIKDNDGQGKQPKFETERSKFLFCKMCLKVIREPKHVTSTYRYFFIPFPLSTKFKQPSLLSFITMSLFLSTECGRHM